MNYTFDDVLIKPNFSTIKSRKDVDISTKLGPLTLAIPIISANMDTVTGPHMAAAMSDAGGLGCLHRFWDIKTQSKEVRNLLGQSCHNISCSVGVGELELERAIKMIDLGVKVITIDVAHGAQQQVVDQYKAIKNYKPDVFLIVGNFATKDSILEFVSRCGFTYMKDFNNEAAIKVGIGPGSACTTRIKTGVGVPQLSAIMDCVQSGATIIADGGMKTSGDVAKALAIGAKCVMLGGMLAGTDESPGKSIYAPAETGDRDLQCIGKQYRGSASKESYEVQGKEASHRTAEGESFIVPYKGPVASVLQDIEGGLRSALTYVGASNLEEFVEKSTLVIVSNSSKLENGAHGKK